MLAKNGVPWNVVMELDDTERQGMCIAFGLLDGNEYDWNAKRWVRPNA